MRLNVWAEHMSEFIIYMGAVLGLLQTVNPGGHPIDFGNAVECLAALQYIHLLHTQSCLCKAVAHRLTTTSCTCLGSEYTSKHHTTSASVFKIE